MCIFKKIGDEYNEQQYMADRRDEHTPETEENDDDLNMTGLTMTAGGMQQTNNNVGMVRSTSEPTNVNSKDINNKFQNPRKIGGGMMVFTKTQTQTQTQNTSQQQQQQQQQAALAAPPRQMTEEEIRGQEQELFEDVNDDLTLDEEIDTGVIASGDGSQQLTQSQSAVDLNVNSNANVNVNVNANVSGNTNVVNLKKKGRSRRKKSKAWQQSENDNERGQSHSSTRKSNVGLSLEEIQVGIFCV